MLNSSDQATCMWSGTFGRGTAVSGGASFAARMTLVTMAGVMSANGGRRSVVTSSRRRWTSSDTRDARSTLAM